MRTILSAIAISVVACAAMAAAAATVAYRPNFIDFGPGVIRMFNGNAGDGSVTVYSQIPNSRTAIDLGPTRATLPSEHALAEFVLYRTRDQGTDFERMNWTAGAASIPMYRFGVERGGSGLFRDVQFCFEDVTPGISRCPLILAPPSPLLPTQLLIEVNPDGAGYRTRVVELGPSDGSGYRVLRVAE